MDGTGKQLAEIAGRALAGQIGNGIAEMQDPALTQAHQTVCMLIAYSEPTIITMCSHFASELICSSQNDFQ